MLRSRPTCRSTWLWCACLFLAVYARVAVANWLWPSSVEKVTVVQEPSHDGTIPWGTSMEVISVIDDHGEEIQLKAMKYRDPLNEPEARAAKQRSVPEPSSKERMPLWLQSEKDLAADKRNFDRSREHMALVKSGIDEKKRWFPFLLSDSKRCIEDLPVKNSAIHWSSSTDPHVDSGMKGYLHDEFRQSIYDNWILKMEIIYEFHSGIKTL